MTFSRITVDAARMGGVSCVRDLRFPVTNVVAMVADGMNVDEILAEHPELEADDVAESLRYAALAPFTSSRNANRREVLARPGAARASAEGVGSR